MRERRSTDDDFFNLADLKIYMSMTAEEKLNHLEEINAFLSETMPHASKTIWEKLKKEGW